MALFVELDRNIGMSLLDFRVFKSLKETVIHREIEMVHTDTQAFISDRIFSQRVHIKPKQCAKVYNINGIAKPKLY